MDDSKHGGKKDSVSVSSASLLRKPDTSLTLKTAKQFALESKRQMLQQHRSTGKVLIVTMSGGVSKGARMLSPQEMEVLRQTKRSVAKRTMEVLAGAA